MASALTMTFSDGSVVLFDAGEACSRAMLRDRIDLNRISMVAISHLHADHWCGLPALIVAWSQRKRTAPVDILVPRGSQEFFKSVQQRSYSFRENLSFQIHYRLLSSCSLPDGWRVELFPTTHLAKVKALAVGHGQIGIAYGYVLSKGKRRIVLSQDIGGVDDIGPVLKGAELLVCESAHIDPLEVLLLARRMDVRRVIFTHIPPDGADFPQKLDGIEWGVAEDGMAVGIPR